MVSPRTRISPSRPRKNSDARCRAVPVLIRGAQTPTELVDHRLRQQGHRHLSITNIDIHRAAPSPAQALLEVEKLLDVPALRIVVGDGLDGIVIRRGEKGVESPFLGPLSLTLDQFVVRAKLAVVGQIRLDCCSVSGPVSRECFGRHLFPTALMALAVGDRHNKIKRCLAADMVEEFRGEVFRIGGHQRTPRQRT